MPIKKVYFDENEAECISCGNCSDIAPEVFEIPGNLSLKNNVDIYKYEKIIRLAVFFCPINRIKIEEALIDEM